MKTKELGSKVARVAVVNPGMEQYYQIERCSGLVSINNLESYTRLYAISDTLIGSFDETSETRFIPAADRLALQKLAYKYSRTPLDEREDEPKFRVRILPDDDNAYLNQSGTDKNLYAADFEDMPTDKTIFTKSEYEKVQQAHPKWLPKFDKDDPHFEFLEEDK